MSQTRVVVLVSANAEWNPVKEVLKPPRLDVSPYGEFFVHAVGNEPVLFLHGGWGKVSAAASTEYAISRWQPNVLINIGTCGGIEGRVERGDKLLVTRAVAYDIHEAIGDPTEAISAYTTELDLSWLDCAFPIALRQASLVSGDRDLVPSEVSDLITRFDASAGDWESAAIAWVARRRNTRVLIIRAVSDLVNTKDGEALGAPHLFESAATEVMQSLLDDLTVLVPFVLRSVVSRP